MAKFKYGANFDAGLDDFQGNLELKVKKNGEGATWTDDVTGAKIVMEGKGLEASKEDDDLFGAGKITSAMVTDGDDRTIIAISDLSVKAVKIISVYNEQDLEGLAFFLAKGDDTVIGSKRGDSLIGGAGDDKMTGGDGSDEFHFQIPIEQRRMVIPVEHDVITDFDTTGMDADFLILRQEFDTKSVHNKQDTQLVFDNGSTLLLEDVTKAQFQEYLANLQG